MNTFQQTVRKTCQKMKLPVWTVLQVRHSRATEIRERYGLEGAAASLGDSVEAAAIYAEKSQHLYGRAIDVSFDRRLLDAETAARRMARGGVGWYPRSHFIHLDTGPTRSWEMDGTGLDRMLAGGGHLAPSGHPLRVTDRLARHRALARREFLHRQ